MCMFSFGSPLTKRIPSERSTIALDRGYVRLVWLKSLRRPAPAHHLRIEKHGFTMQLRMPSRGKQPH